MTPPINQLERLARLRADGLLSEAELAHAKAKLIGPAAAPSTADIVQTNPPPRDDADLSPIWRERFRFLDRHGMPGTAGYQRAIKQASFRARRRLGFSTPAFLLCPFYWLYLGLWRPTLLVAALTVTGALVLDWLGAPGWVDRVAWVVPASVHASCAVPLYYLRRRYGIQRWNPLSWQAAGRT